MHIGRSRSNVGATGGGSERLAQRAGPRTGSLSDSLDELNSLLGVSNLGCCSRSGEPRGRPLSLDGRKWAESGQIGAARASIEACRSPRRNRGVGEAVHDLFASSCQCQGVKQVGASVQARLLASSQVADAAARIGALWALGRRYPPILQLAASLAAALHARIGSHGPAERLTNTSACHRSCAQWLRPPPPPPPAPLAAAGSCERPRRCWPLPPCCWQRALLLRGPCWRRRQSPRQLQLWAQKAQLSRAPMLRLPLAPLRMPARSALWSTPGQSCASSLLT